MGQTVTLCAEAPVGGLHWWSWGYGYLYDVRTALKVDGRVVDEVTTRTGFRKTRFAEGKIWINDRVLPVSLRTSDSAWSSALRSLTRMSAAYT